MAAAAMAVAAAAATVSAAGGRGDPTLHSLSAAAVVASPPRWRLPVGCVARVAAAPTGARGPLFPPSLRGAPPPPPSQRHLLIPTNGNRVRASVVYPGGVGAGASDSVRDGGKSSKSTRRPAGIRTYPNFLGEHPWRTQGQGHFTRWFGSVSSDVSGGAWGSARVYAPL